VLKSYFEMKWESSKKGFDKSLLHFSLLHSLNFNDWKESFSLRVISIPFQWRFCRWKHFNDIKAFKKIETLIVMTFCLWQQRIDCLLQGILKGEVSLYGWPPVWPVWNQLYDLWQFLFLFAKQTNPNQSNRRSTVQWYFPL
jgi:hypothetical protein